ERQLLFNEWYELKNGVRVYIGDVSHETKLNKLGKSMQYYFSSKNFFAPFKIRPRKSGDRIALKGMAESKRLSRLFIDEKIPLTERDSWPILVDANEEVLCVLGIRTNKNLSKNKRPQDDIKIVIEYNNV
ncbi:tRNA(Ile)-lysidine synthetase, partial [Butyricicoccus sp. 1XD8-22]